MTSFEAALRFTLRWEGGRVDDPDDLGGRTAYGVTQRTYDGWRRAQGLPARDVWQITPAETHTIYRERYWRPMTGWAPPALYAAAFDFAVHSGGRRARERLPASGDLGAYLAARRAWFDEIVRARPKQAKYLRGWNRRVDALAAFLERAAVVASWRAAA